MSSVTEHVDKVIRPVLRMAAYSRKKHIVGAMFWE